MKKYLDKIGLQDYTTKLIAKIKTIFATKTEVGSPLVALTSADMTETNKIYVYVGSETGYTNGNWYYYDGTSWTSGGIYNSIAVTTDTSLSLPGVPADAKSTGDAIPQSKTYSQTHDTTGYLPPLDVNKSIDDAITSGLIFENGSLIYTDLDGINHDLGSI